MDVVAEEFSISIFKTDPFEGFPILARVSVDNSAKYTPKDAMILLM